MRRGVVMAAVLGMALGSAGLAAADVAPDPDPTPAPEDGCGCGASTTGELGGGALAVGAAGLGLAWTLRSSRRGRRAPRG
jgi:hypothetical protein